MTLQIATYDHPPGPLPVRMAKSDGTAAPLLKLDRFGADLIRFAPGRGVELHTHPGAHVLVVVSGSGWLSYGSSPRHRLIPGTIYMVPGHVPHAIHAADDELTLIAVGNDHHHAASEHRLDLAQLGSKHAAT